MQLSARRQLAHPGVMSPTRRADNRNTQGHVSSERAHRPNRTRTQPHPASAERSHTYAVHTLLDWYRSGENIDHRMPLLSTYLGHVDPASTYWYLEAVPELLQLVSQRLEQLPGASS